MAGAINWTIAKEKARVFKATGTRYKQPRVAKDSSADKDRFHITYTHAYIHKYVST